MLPPAHKPTGQPRPSARGPQRSSREVERINNGPNDSHAVKIQFQRKTSSLGQVPVCGRSQDLLLCRSEPCSISVGSCFEMEESRSLISHHACPR